MGKWTTEQLTCPECGFIAKDMRGLNGHRQFKHGVHPAAPQLPLQKQDLLVSESTLERILDQRFSTISEQLNTLTGAVTELRDCEVAELQERLRAQEQRRINDFDEHAQALYLIEALYKLDVETVRTLLEKADKSDILQTPLDPELSKWIGELLTKDDGPGWVDGRKEEPGWKYYDALKISVKVGDER